MRKDTPLERLYNGIIKENPTFVMMLGMCPTLAVTTSAKNGIGMGLATMVILTASNLMISLLRKIIPDGVRMPAYIVVVASFVTIVEFLMEGFIPALYSALGIYIPLIVVNCIILGRAEAYAGKHGPIPSLFDGIGMGLGFTVGLTLIGMFRELIGAGTLFGIQVMPSAYEPVNIFIMAPGAFLVLAMLVAVQNRIKRQKSEKTGKPAVPAEETGCMACANKAYCQAVKGKEEAKELILIAIGAALVNNVVLSQFLGICAFLGVSKKMDTAAGMGGAVIFVLTISSFVTSLIYKFILAPAELDYLKTIVFILVIAALVQLVEMFLKKTIPSLYRALGVYLPLITTNCAVLGVALINVQKDYTILQGTIYGLATAIGFTIAMVLMAGLREKMEYNDIPESFKGMPIVLLTAMLMSMAFMGFSGMI